MLVVCSSLYKPTHAFPTTLLEWHRDLNHRTLYIHELSSRFSTALAKYINKNLHNLPTLNLHSLQIPELDRM